MLLQQLLLLLLLTMCRSYSDAEPGLVCPTDAAAATTSAAATSAAATSAAAATGDVFRETKNPHRTNATAAVRKCSFVLVQHNNPYSPSMMMRRSF